MAFLVVRTGVIYRQFAVELLYQPWPYPFWWPLILTPLLIAATMLKPLSSEDKPQSGFLFLFNNKFAARTKATKWSLGHHAGTH